MGLKAGFVIPIIANEEVLAVMEFFMGEMMEEDKRMIEIISAVSAQLGNVFLRKLSDDARHQVQERFERLVNDLNVIIFRTKDDCSLIDINQAGIVLFEADSKAELLRHNWKDFFNNKDIHKKLLDNLFKNGFIKDEEIELVSTKGNIFWGSISAIVTREKDGTLYIDGILEDISNRKKLEGQLMHAQKMEAVGQLAGGIAHDFNNTLTAIMGFGNLLIMKRREDELIKNFAGQILEAARKSTDMVKNLLTFGRKHTLNPQPADLNDIVRTSEMILKRLISEDIELKTILKKESLISKVDLVQIEQVLMNLATNARDAMPKGGKITISTEVAKIDDDFVNQYGYGAHGNYALIAFSDTGHGMDEITKKKIFEPFFTTKEVGRGTGLGLATVYSIIKQHNGYINVRSEIGKGTMFEIYLPILEQAIAVKKSMDAELPKGGTETVLLAEDDERVRLTTQILLSESGYKVIEAANGKDAINKFIESKDKINLLIFDLIMPEKSGKDVYDEIKKIKPDIKILFMSGHSEDKRKGLLEEGFDFMSKPFQTHELLRKVREVLDKNNDK